MEKVVYQGEYPNELKRKWELYEKGLKPTEESVAVFLSEKGKEIQLFQEDLTEPLTLDDGNHELCFWREGLKKEKHLNLALIQQLEKQIKSRILKNESAKIWLTEANLFFNQEYPTDEFIKTEDLKRLGFKPKEPVGAYINGEKATPLYSLKNAEPLTIETATPGEKKRWIEGLEQGLIPNLSETERLSLIKSIQQSLENSEPKKKTQSKERKPKKETVSKKKPSLETKKTTTELNPKETKKPSSKKRDESRSKRDIKKEHPKTLIIDSVKALKVFGEQIPYLSFSTLKKDVKTNPDDYLFLNVVGTGIFFQDELFELSLIDGKGNMIYHQHFLPSSSLSKQRNLPNKEVHRVPFTDVVSNIDSFIGTKTLLIYNPKYVLPLSKRTFEKYKLPFPTIRWIDLTSLFKNEWGSSSLETGTKHLSWTIDKSTLVYDALMSGYVCLSLLQLSDEWLAKQEQAKIVFESYCSLRNNPTEARLKGWEWLRKELRLQPNVSSFQSLGLNQCDYVIQKLQRFILPTN